MPLESKPLGYNCPVCKQNCGSETFFQVNPRSPIKSSKVNPVEYAFLKQKIIRHEEDFLENLAARVSTLPKWNSLDSDPEKERQRRLNLIRSLKKRMEARDKARLEEEEEDSKWDVIQQVDDTENSRVHGIMKKMLQLQFGSSGLRLENIEDNSGNVKTVYKWNAMKEIKKYRRTGDLLRHIYIPMDYLPRVVASYPHDRQLMDYISGEKKHLWKKACQIMDRYMEQFCSGVWNYKWLERFWIVAYTEAMGVGQTRSMLRELDGEKEKRPLSRKYLKKQREAVLKFWEEFLEYIPYLFDGAARISNLIEHDVDLKKKYEEDTPARIDRANEGYNKKIKHELIQAMMQQYYYGNDNTAYDDTVSRLLNNCSHRNDDKNIFIDSGRDRIKITHSNPYYRKEKEKFKREMDAFNEGIRLVPPKKKPKQKIQCTFNPWTSLSPMKLVELLRQHKLSI